MNRGKQGVVNIHGKEYHTVALRMQHFREKYPIDHGYGVLTELLSEDQDGFTVKASITKDGAALATGLAREEKAASRINKTSALENAETSAIGRALAACGFGTEGTYASADELATKLQMQTTGTLPEQPRKTQSPQANVAKPQSSVDKFLDQKIGFSSTGELTWRDAAEDVKKLVDGTSARSYLHKLAAWKNTDPSKKDVSRKAQTALDFVANKRKG